jgi:general secretion pathway protein D
MLLITASRSEYKRIVGILDRIDTLPDQVLIEATIAEVTLNDTLRMGVRWFFEAGRSQTALTDKTAVTGSLINAIVPNLPGFSYALNAANVRVVLDALSDVTDVNIVSSPTLTVLDGKRASLQIGDEVPILTQQAQATGAGAAPIINSVTYRNTGVILGLVPRINEKGRVLLEIEQEVSEVGASPGSNVGGSPTITQRRIKTTVAVKDGESLTLGGLMQDRSNVGRTQVPILGEVPVVGNLFKSKDDTIKRTELLIIITPRVVRDVNQMRGITDEFRDRLNLTLRPQRQAPPRLRENLERIQR